MSVPASTCEGIAQQRHCAPASCDMLPCWKGGALVGRCLIGVCFAKNYCWYPGGQLVTSTATGTSARNPWRPHAAGGCVPARQLCADAKPEQRQKRCVAARLGIRRRQQRLCGGVSAASIHQQQREDNPPASIHWHQREDNFHAPRPCREGLTQQSLKSRLRSRESGASSGCNQDSIFCGGAAMASPLGIIVAFAFLSASDLMPSSGEA